MEPGTWGLTMCKQRCGWARGSGEGEVETVNIEDRTGRLRPRPTARTHSPCAKLRRDGNVERCKDAWASWAGLDAPLAGFSQAGCCFFSKWAVLAGPLPPFETGVWGTLVYNCSTRNRLRSVRIITLQTVRGSTGIATVRTNCSSTLAQPTTWEFPFIVAAEEPLVEIVRNGVLDAICSRPIAPSYVPAIPAWLSRVRYHSVQDNKRRDCAPLEASVVLDPGCWQRGPAV